VNKLKTGGSAFPTQEERYPDGLLSQEATYGMTLRDYFAAKAMSQMLSICGTRDTAAVEAYRVADAMLKARNGNS